MKRRVKVTEEANSVFSIDLFTERKCRRAIKRLKEMDNWREAQVLATDSDGAPIAVRNSEVRTARLFTRSGNLKIRREFEARINDSVLPLVRSLWKVDLEYYSEIQIVRYGPGGHYLPHADGGYFMKERYFTLVCYLNDDFTGGSTSFPSVPYAALPKTGKVLLFPARFVHCAEPVLTGEKFVMVCWLIGPPPVEWIR